MATISDRSPAFRVFDRFGRATVGAVEQVGRGAALVFESVYWLIAGHRQGQPVRARAVFAQMMEIGVKAVPIVGVMAATIGVMLAIQGIYTLRIFGAESRVTIGIALSMTREFAPLITGILVAGRSGSALAARIGTMKINQELDALSVMGINPVRFLVVPALLGCLVMLPVLTIFSNIVGLAAAGAYVGVELGMSMAAYGDELVAVLTQNDILHGIGKSAIFAVLIAVIGVLNGASVTGGAEGVGRYTTRAVVQSIAAIVITDMLFVFVVTR
jgi:phospholipid/cholesterol/gamma-HCH transport system permease protein